MLNTLHFTLENETLKQHAYDAVMKEQEHIGYYALPDTDPSEYINFCKTLNDTIETIVVIGIGGSSLGAKAIYEFLKPKLAFKRKLIFLESTDPTALQGTLERIDFTKSHIFVISKSGTTVETFAIYKYIFALFSHPNHYTFITDPNSKLQAYAKEIGSTYFNLPANVGGRFSVLSAVGLLPLAACGVDIEALLAGARHIKKSFFEGGYFKNVLLTKAVFYAKHHAQYHINCLFAYSESLKHFCEWYVQLWGESLGKRQRHSAFHVGLTPIGLIGPKDQHSFLQLIMEGTRDKSVTFLKIEDFDETLSIPTLSLPHLETLDMLNGISFEKLINMQCDAVTEALLNEKDIPVDTIVIPKADAYNIGALIFYYELLTSLVGELIDVNTYDQPGVEAGKRILSAKLGSFHRK
jgi:glucose-6-phosphate isomerase